MTRFGAEFNVRVFLFRFLRYDEIMLKILYVITQSELGGAQKYVFDMAQGARRQGYDVTVASAPNPSFRDALEHNGVVFRELKHSRRALHFLTDIKLLLSLVKLLRTEKPDILHLNSSKIGGLGALAGKLCHVRKIIFTAHGWAFNERRPWWQQTAIILASRFAALFQDTIICVSDFDRKAALARKVAPESKLVTVHNGIDVKEFMFLSKEEAREKLGIGQDNFVVGTVANLYKNKSLDTLVLSAISASHAVPDIRFVIIGEGVERARLESMIAKYHLSGHVTLAGALENAPHYLKAFDVFCLPSKKEGLPYTLLEAMAARVPVIASAVGGIPEIITHEKNGLLLKPASPGTLWDAIAFLMKNKKKAKEMQTAAFETVKTGFSRKRMIEETLALYAQQRP